jgi:hypothetical protein
MKWLLNMTYQKKVVLMSDKETLIQMVMDLQLRLKKKNSEPHRARMKLKAAKDKMTKKKDTVIFQRNRILELYPN